MKKHKNKIHKYLMIAGTVCLLQFVHNSNAQAADDSYSFEEGAQDKEIVYDEGTSPQYISGSSTTYSGGDNDLHTTTTWHTYTKNCTLPYPKYIDGVTDDDLKSTCEDNKKDEEKYAGEDKNYQQETSEGSYEIDKNYYSGGDGTVVFQKKPNTRFGGKIGYDSEGNKSAVLNVDLEDGSTVIMQENSKIFIESQKKFTGEVTGQKTEDDKNDEYMGQYTLIDGEDGDEGEGGNFGDSLESEVDISATFIYSKTTEETVTLKEEEGKEGSFDIGSNGEGATLYHTEGDIELGDDVTLNVNKNSQYIRGGNGTFSGGITNITKDSSLIFLDDLDDGIIEHTGKIMLKDGGILKIGLNKITNITDLTTESQSKILAVIKDSDRYSQLVTDTTNINDKTKFYIALEGADALRDDTEFTFITGTEINDIDVKEDYILVDFEQNKTENEKFIATAKRKKLADVLTFKNETDKAIANELDTVYAKHGEKKEVSRFFGVLDKYTSADKLAQATSVSNFAPQTENVDASFSTQNAQLGNISSRLQQVNNRGFQHNNYQTPLGGGGSYGSGISGGDNSKIGIGTWVQGIGGLAKQTETDSQNGYESAIAGISIGVDKKITENFILGTSYGYGRTEVSYTDAKDGDSLNVDSHQLTLYGSYQNPNGLFVDGMVNGGINSNQGTRQSDLHGVLETDYSSKQFGARSRVGKQFGFNNWLVTPSVGAQYSYLVVDEYSDNNIQYTGITVDATNYDKLESILGIELGYRYNLPSSTLTTSMHADWLYDALGSEHETTARLQGGETSFTIADSNDDRSTFITGVNVNWENDSDLSINAGYNAEIKSDYLGHVGNLKVKYNF